MKGKQGSPVQSRTPRRGTAGAQEKGGPTSSSTGSNQQKSGDADGSSKKPQGKARKLVYRYGQNKETPAASAGPTTSINIMEAAQAVMKKNMLAAASGNVQLKIVGEAKSAESAGTEEDPAEETVTETVLDVSEFDIGQISETGKKIIKSLPGQTYIQEVRTESGEFLNFRCKLCKVRFTDLKEIHMRGRRHRLNLANAQKKANPKPPAPNPPVVAQDQEKIVNAPTVKKKPAVKKPVKKYPPVRKPPAILDNLIRSNIANNIAEVLRQEKKKENFTIYRLYKEMRESCVISDRWCIPEPLWDPHTNREVLLCYETDVLMDGSVRMKRCLKVLDNFELIVLLDGVDKTHIFKDKHPTIKSTQEMLDLIRKVTMVKVCSGVKDCDPSELENINTKVIQKGGSWYSTECNVEVERGCLGNICKRCTSLRNTLRRKMRRQYGLDSTNPTPSTSRTLLSNTMKPVLRTVGEALYLNLQHMSRVNRSSVSSDEEPPVPRSQDQVLHPELGIYMNAELKERLDEVAANPPPPLTKIEHIVEYDPRTMTKTLKRIHTPIAPSSLRGTLSAFGGGSTSLRVGGSKRVKPDILPNVVVGNNNEVTFVQTPNGETIQLPEGYMLADESQQWGDGNIVIQKVPEAQQDQEQFIIGEDNSIIQVGNLSGNFTLEDGEEYEVIGEAPSGADGDAIQVLPLATNSDIEIIEVDENMIQLVDENSQPEIQPVDSSSDIFKFLQAHSRLSGH